MHKNNLFFKKKEKRRKAAQKVIITLGVIFSILFFFSFSLVSAFNFPSQTQTIGGNNIYIIENDTELQHNNMSGLQGGSDTERYHITSAWYNELLSDIFNWITQDEGDARYIQTESDPLAYNGTLAYNSSLDNYYLKSNPFGFWNDTYATFNKTYADTLYASAGAGNASFNQTLTDILYAGIEWDYNQTTAAVNILNGTGLIKDWNATGYIIDWNSTGYIKDWSGDIVSANISLYDWVVAQNYLTSYTETDPLWTGNYSDYLTLFLWNKTYADTLYAPISVTGDNSSWNETHANTLYYGISNPYSYYNETTLPDLNSTGLIIDWNSSGYIKDWNSTGLIINWSYVDTNTEYTAGQDLILTGTEFSSNRTSLKDYFDTVYHPLWDYDFGDLINVPSFLTSAVTSIFSANSYISTNSSDGSVEITFNETKLNETIDLRDSDTTYTAGNKLYLDGTQFNVNDSLINQSIEAYNYLTSYSETDPLWSANQSSYSTTADILAFGYYNASDFVITDYYTKSQVDGFNFYNATDFNIADYSTTTTILNWNYFNSTNFPYTHLGNFTDNLGNRGYTHLSNFTNDGVFITNATMNKTVDWNDVIGEPTFIQTESDPEAYNGTLAYNSSLSNYVPYSGASSNLVLGDNNFSVNGTTLFVNSNTGNVGIGTTSPGSKLDVNGTGSFSDDLSLTGVGSSYKGNSWISNAASTGIGLFGVGDAGFYTAAGGTLRFVTYDGSSSEVETMALYNGNVGIGTTSPGAKLHVDGTNAFNQPNFLVDDDSGRTTAMSGEGFWRVDGTGDGDGLVFNRVGYNSGTTKFRDVLFMNGKGTTVMQIDGSGGNIRVDEMQALTSAGLSLKPQTGTGIFVQDTTGNVGIGTTSPGTPLHVAGTPLGSSELRYGVQIDDTSRAYNNNPLTGFAGRGKYNSAGDLTQFGGFGVGKEDTTDGNINGYSAIYTRESAGALAEQMRITSVGNVGIGTTSPSEKLHIAGNLFLQNDSNKIYIGQAKDVSFSFDGSNTQFINEVGTGNFEFSGQINSTAGINNNNQNITAVDCILFTSGGQICSG